MADSLDVQAMAADHPFQLARVGVKGVRKPVRVSRPGQPEHDVVALFDMFVDLPSTQKGTHMSRNLEALADVLDEEIMDKSANSLEGLCGRLVGRLLDKHDYAHVAEVSVAGDFFLTKTNPGGKPTIEAYKINAGAKCARGGSLMRRVGVEVIGMSACPCAMETARHKFTEAGKPPREDIPFITHNQRNRVTLSIETPANEAEAIEAADLVQLCEDALSAPTYELLKRGDEGDLVIQAHESPRFVEDVVRALLFAVSKRYEGLPASSKVYASSEAEESIHKHNAYAQLSATMGELLA